MSIRHFSDYNSMRVLESPHTKMKTPKREATGDRFISSRSAMSQAGSIQSFPLSRPENDLQRRCIQSQFPNYSDATLLNTAARPYNVSNQSPKLRWQFPEERFNMLMASGMAANFYTNNIDWGKHLLGVNVANTCLVRNAKTQKVTEIFQHTQELSSLKWNPTGELVACGSIDSSITFLDNEGMQLFRPLSLGQASLFSSDWRSENDIFIGSYEQISHIDLREGFPSGSISLEANGNICSVKVSHNQTLLATGNNSDSDQVQIFDIRAMENGPVQSYSHRSGVKALQWMKGSSTQLLSGGGTDDRMIKLFDMHRQKVISEKFTGFQICSVELLDETYFMLGMGYHASPNIQFYRYLPDEKTLQMLGGIKEGRGRILDIVKDPNTSEVCSHSDDNILSFWRFEPLQSKPSREPFSGLKTIR